MPTQNESQLQFMPLGGEYVPHIPSQLFVKQRFWLLSIVLTQLPPTQLSTVQ
jgi:hypothetical protein